MKKILNLIGLTFIVVFLSACGGEEATTVIEDTGSFKEQKIQSNKNFNLKTTDSKIINFEVIGENLISKELNGKYVLFNFWATWCAPCIEEMPTLVKLQEEYADKLQIVGVLIEKKDKKELEAFMDKFNINFPITIGDENFRMARVFDDVKMFPESFVYSPNGKFMKKFIGIIREPELTNLINR